MSNSWDIAYLLWSSVNKDMSYSALSATYWFAIQAKRPLKKEGKESIIKKKKSKKINLQTAVPGMLWKRLYLRIVQSLAMILWFT